MKRVFALTILSCLFSANASPFALRQLSLEEMVRRASDVVIGTVEDIEPKDEDGRRFAWVRVETNLKGEAPETIRVLTSGSIAEHSFYVSLGRRYLFFLAKPTVNPDEYFYSVNGRFGVTPLDGKPPDMPPLPATVANATVVVIGTVETLQPRTYPGQNEFVLVRVDNILDGEPPKTIRLLTKGSDPSRDIVCEVGRQYLLYLTEHADYFQSANGMHGVVSLDGPPRRVN